MFAGTTEAMNFYVRVSMDGDRWEWIYQHRLDFTIMRDKSVLSVAKSAVFTTLFLGLYRNLRLSTMLRGHEGDFETPFHSDVYSNNGGYIANFARFYPTDGNNADYAFTVFGCVAEQTGINKHCIM